MKTYEEILAGSKITLEVSDGIEQVDVPKLIGMTEEELDKYYEDYLDTYCLEKPHLGYGHRRIPNNGDAAFRLDGVDYKISAGLDVPAISAGKVVYTGYDELLGKFVVVDHGLGLKTWYCHLGDIVTTTGVMVAKGDTVGKTGRTGYINHDGVYLITTVMDVPVSPYSLQDNGLTLPTPNE